MPCLLSLLVAGSVAAQPNLLANPGFEDGLAHWATANDWYQGTGQGLSACAADPTVVHAGAASLCITGTNNRGIAIEALTVFPTRYRLEGWLRCEGLTGKATFAIEFIKPDGTWISFTGVGSVEGTADWTHVEAEVEAPPEAASAHVDCLTSDPNNGRAWFDDLSLVGLGTPDADAPPPVPVEARSAGEGAVTVAWPAFKAPTDTATYLVYAEPRPFTSTKGLLPKAVSGRFTREATVGGVTPGATVHVAVIATDRWGNRMTDADSQEVSLMDTLAPHPVAGLTVTPVIGPGGERCALVEWLAHHLDWDVARWRVQSGTAEQIVPAPGREALIDAIVDDVPFRVLLRNLPAGDVQVAVVAEDAAGNRGEAATAPVPPLPPTAQTGSPVAMLPDSVGVREVYGTDGAARWGPVLAVDAEVTPARPGGASPIRAWAVSGLDKVFRDDPVPAQPATAIRLLAARGETEVAQVTIHADADARVTLRAAPLGREGAPLTGARVRWDFVGYVHVERNSTAAPPEELLRPAPADFPDRLMEQRVVDVPAGENRSALLRVTVPRDAQPGVYESTVHVLANGWAVPISVTLEVLPFELPAQTTLRVTNWFNDGQFGRVPAAPSGDAVWNGFPAEDTTLEPWTEDYWKMVRLFAEDMARHHQNVFMTPLGLVQMFAEDDGTIRYDFARLDRWVETFDAAGVSAGIELGHVGGRTTGEWECPTFSFSTFQATRLSGAGAVDVPVTDLVRALQEHLRERGWLERSMQHIADEPIPVNVDSWREHSRTIHEAAPDLRRMDAIHVTDLTGDLEVWVPQLNYFWDAYPALREKQQEGACELWFYIAWVPQGHFPNRLIDFATIKTRILHWMNYRFGATGYLHWGLNHWGIDFGHFAPGDEWIVWPGTRGPLSSLRWEAQRDGIEDYEYLAMLERALQAKGVADPKARPLELAGELVRAADDYERDPARLAAGREQIAREIVATMGG